MIDNHIDHNDDDDDDDNEHDDDRRVILMRAASYQSSQARFPRTCQLTTDQAAWSNLRSRVNSTFTLLPFPSVNSF